MQAGTQTFEVEGVTSGSSAAQAGLREGLILEKLDRVKVTGWTQQKLDKT
jgi:S1-C subfamily serine protease